MQLFSTTGRSMYSWHSPDLTKDATFNYQTDQPTTKATMYELKQQTNQQYPTTLQLSPCSWSSDSYDQMEQIDCLSGFNVDLLTPQSSPLSSEQAEESYDFANTIDGGLSMPFKFSQDYDDQHAFENEIDQTYYSNEENLKNLIKNESDLNANYIEFTGTFNNSQLTESSENIVFEDKMLLQLNDEVSNLPTVKSFSDIILKPDQEINMAEETLNTPQPAVEQPIVFLQVQQVATNTTNATNNKIQYNVQYSPVSSDDDATIDRVECNENEAAMDLLIENIVAANTVDFTAVTRNDEERLQQEHNYIINIRNKDTNNSAIAPIVTIAAPAPVMEPTTKPPASVRRSNRRRVPALKLKIVQPVAVVQQLPAQIDVSTPDITDDILDMEDEPFDLIAYIGSTESNLEIVNKDEMIDTANLKRSPTHLNFEPYLETPASTPKPAKRRRISYDNPGSVQSFTSTNVSDDSFAPSTPASTTSTKRRGRPPKTSCEPPSPSQYKHLTPEGFKYMQMRNKNNEASRRSRLNRKGKENAIDVEARLLEEQYRKLAARDEEVQRECARWRRAVMRLALK